MADYGEKYTDKRIRETDKKIRETYKTAQRELKAKLADFNQKFDKKDAKKRQQLAAGEITKQEYKDWLTGQVFMREQWKSSLREVNQVLLHSNQQAVNVINDGRLDVFAENYNFMAFKGEGSTGISFDVYNTQAVARLIADDPKLLPEWKIDEEKDYTWNAKKVNNIVQQGIIQGEGVKEITDRLSRDLVTQNENRMRLFARTAYVGAQNAGRQQQMNDAADMGLEVHKQWLATLDNKTRDTHRKLDGEEVPYNENFSNDLEYPGDPDGDPAEVYNCRCTMVTIYPKYEDRSKPSWREEQDIDGQCYEEWKEGKQANGHIAGEGARSYWKGQIKERYALADGPTIQLPKYQDEFASKGYVGLSGSESDAFMDQYHNKSIIGRHGENTMLGSQSRRINEALRNDKEPEKPEDKKMVERLDKAIQSNALPQDMTLYRGASIEAFANTGLFDGFEKISVNMEDFKKNGQIDFDEWGKAYKKAEEQNLHNLLERAKGLIGKEQTDKGYMQVSASSERNFFGFSTFNLQIHAKEGTKAYISDYKSESEIILARGSTIRIVDVTISTVKAQNGNSMEVVQLIAELVD